ncbi:MAG: HAD family phosphatase [Pirellulales bacterium]|nr:HAD family phosphatase [Pirellulales bacterium]
MPKTPHNQFPQSPAKAVVFDLDGLMFNTEELYQFVGGEVLRRRGKTFDADLLDAMMGRPGSIALQLMIDWHQLVDSIEQLETESDEVFAGVLDSRLETMPGLLDLLAALERARIPKAIATSSRRAFVVDVLSRFGLEPRFEFILTAEDVVQGKPFPEIYQRAAARFDLEPRELLVLEDSENGCRAAAAAGAFTIAVPGGHSRRHNFDKASLVVESLADPRVYEALGLARE